jgi:hypothetical protein
MIRTPPLSTYDDPPPTGVSGEPRWRPVHPALAPFVGSDPITMRLVMLLVSHPHLVPTKPADVPAMDEPAKRALLDRLVSELGLDKPVPTTFPFVG